MSTTQVKSRKFLGRDGHGVRKPGSGRMRGDPARAAIAIRLCPLVLRNPLVRPRRAVRTGEQDDGLFNHASLRCYFLQPRFRSNGGQPCDLRSAPRSWRARAPPATRATRADAAVKRAAAEADAKRAYPTTPSGVALKNKISERCRDPRKLASADAKKTATAKTPKRVSLEALKALTGTRLRVFWPLENAFFKGKVVAFDRFTMKHRVRYEDGDAEWLELFRGACGGTSRRATSRAPRSRRRRGNRRRSRFSFRQRRRERRSRTVRSR